MNTTPSQADHRRTIIGNRELKFLSVILVLALLNGVWYIAIVPPWQHYDEPNHFEYAWLLANRSGLPNAGDYDQGMRRAVAQSMIDYGFFEGLGFLPELDNTEQPIWIGGYSQLNDLPLYYLIASLPLRMFPDANVTSQLYALRSVSLLFFLVTVFASWRIASLLTPQRHSVRILLPFTLALLPGFVDIMTAVNNDSAAIAIFSLFLWAQLALIIKGFSIGRLIYAAIPAILAYWTKNTIYIAIPFFVISLLFSLSRKRFWRLSVWGVILAGIGVSLLFVLSWGDAALWDRNTLQESPTRAFISPAPVGEYALRLDISPDRSDRVSQIRQIIPPKVVRELGGRNVTLGAWIWSSQPVHVIPLRLADGGLHQADADPITLGTQPVFVAVQAKLPRKTDRAWVILLPWYEEMDTDVTIYFDGLVLAEGNKPLTIAPAFTNANSSQGVWGRKPFANLLRNASAESSWSQIRSWADELGSKLLPDNGRPSLVLYSLLDMKATGEYYDLTTSVLFRSFWAVFGWGHVFLLGHNPYQKLGVVTLVGMIGAIIALGRIKRAIQSHKWIDWEALGFLGMTLISVWGITWVRGSIYLFYRLYFPIARYAYPVIIPTMLILTVGLWEVLNRSSKKLHLPEWIPLSVYCAFFLFLDIYSLVSIHLFYT